MSILKMKRLKLMVLSSQKEELLKDLMLLRCVQISEPKPYLDDEDSMKLSGYKQANLSRYRAEYISVANAIKLLDKYASKKTRMLAPLPDVEVKRLLDEQTLEVDIGTAERIVGLEDSIRGLTAEESRIRSEIETISPWVELELPLDFKGSETCHYLIASLPVSADINTALAALHDATEYAEIFSVSSDRVANYIVLICLKPELDTAVAALRPFGFAAISLGDVRGTAKETINSAKSRLAEIADTKKKYVEEIAESAEYRPTLKLRADTLTTKIVRAEAEEKLLYTETVLCLEGWIPEENLQVLEERLSGYVCAWGTEDPKEEEYPEVPVKLKNSRLSRPLNMVTNMYSLPAYDGIDPNPLMAPFFVLFFGLMLADVGYGLLMIIMSLLVLKKKRPRGESLHLFELMFICGIATTVCGIFTGGFFSNLIPTVAETFFNIPPDQLPEWLQKFNNGLLVNPLNDSIMILIGSMILGFIQIIFGMLINFVETTKKGHFRDALMDQGSWFLVFIGIAVGAVSGNWWIAIAGLAALLLTQGRSNKTIAGKLFGGIAGLYDITGYFGDILSYSRIMALMLAGSVIGQVFNTLGAIPKNPLLFLIFFIIGHTLNFGLNLLSCYVHDLRLQCLEFFGKFYKDGGRPFKPLSIETQYYNVN